ncbi:hypothetical protein [Actinacidiphila bryophytorum]|uniref:Secreted protein n=1 Tax=Actinacidiphila bryophytorum TaxID=1436133 RepID=A0A9W4GZZ2_9ACTN|nr:hypothetical protein [Actinacidiphila bryophytorum]MBM9440925.1 hypothetical protein [Actinacidiphila bryophytorum]CAG7623826.1 conserved exported hypothetical protein [Actinacidiphila bryophytorum]
MSLRHITTVLGAAAAAVVLSIAVPASAQAAQGILTIDATTYQDPADGCLDVGGPPAPRHFVANDTDAPVLLYTDPGCQGRPVHLVPPGDGDFTPFESVLIGLPD